MDIFLGIIAVIIISFVFGVIYTQLNNFIFLILGKFSVWIFSIVLLTGGFWAICHYFGLDVTYPFIATLYVFISKYPPTLSKSDALHADLQYQAQFNIKKGALKYKIGHITFLILSIAWWIVIYSESGKIA